MPIDPNRSQTLRWQSRLLLIVTIVSVSVSLVFPWIVVFLLDNLASRTFLTGAAIAGAFGLLVWRLRAATPPAAVTGALLTLGFYLATPGPRTLLWPLLALFLLAFAATRFGRARKEELNVAEERKGRTAAQVAANLGAAAMVSIPLSSVHLTVRLLSFAIRPFLIASIASLAEATADTLSSELGEVLGGEPILLTTLRRVPAGTDGAISLAGTLAGCAGAAVIALIAMAALRLSLAEALIAFAAGVLGLFFDSLLGATLERRGWLNNDAVNFLSTCAAAVCAALISARVR
jgi:uncharacterized protein (TIGR00297 family)